MRRDISVCPVDTARFLWLRDDLRRMKFERLEFPQPMCGHVNVSRIGDALVDTGHVAPVCRDAVADALDGPLASV